MADAFSRWSVSQIIEMLDTDKWSRSRFPCHEIYEGLANIGGVGQEDTSLELGQFQLIPRKRTQDEMEEEGSETNVDTLLL